MELNAVGQIIHQTWEWLAQQYGYIELDEFIVMPDHMHGIIFIDQEQGASRSAPTIDKNKIKTLGQLVGAFKTVSTKRINMMRNTVNIPFWQRNFYDHIIRNDEDLNRIREYIINNPIQWDVNESRGASRSAL